MIITLLLDLASVVWIVALVIAGLLLLRMILHWLNLSPFSWLPYNLRRLTEPMLRPLRATTGAILPYDLVPLIMAIFVVTTGLFAASIIQNIAGFLFRLTTHNQTVKDYAKYMIDVLVFVFTVLIFLRIVFSMFGVSYYNRFARFTYQTTEPLLRPLRRHLIVGMFDLSPLVAILLVQIVGWILISIIGS
ncbi:MAG TPA: YggT family protein [Blastocatellia bacterium]|nr:YggT family protein [Blastocatellia bacterium]